MEVSINPTGNKQVNRKTSPASPQEKASIVRELESILSSPFFRTSKRCQEFLSYVVHHELEGNQEPLKERTIGVDLFARPVGYATGDDPVVRVQAGDVRRRLEQYYHATPNHSPVRIELPVGSYTPEFISTQAEPIATETPEPAAVPAKVTTDPTPKKRKKFAWAFLILGLLLAVALAWTITHHTRAPKSALYRFWSPSFTTSGPILICLAKPKVYRPTEDVYRLHSNPGQFDTELEILDSPPPLKPNDVLEWHDMVEYPEFGVARGDVYAAVRLSIMLSQIGKESAVRIGNDYSFEDLRTFPAILVGAFNNRQAMQITSNLHFRFVETNGKQMIQEQGQSGRDWQSKTFQRGNEKIVADDYGLVSRLRDSKTGQFVVTVAGIGANGTQAASELVTSPQYLEAALQNVPRDWMQKDIQFVVHTTVTDSVTGPPQVVATYAW
jgi:hypothetical protein